MDFKLKPCEKIMGKKRKANYEKKTFAYFSRFNNQDSILPTQMSCTRNRVLESRIDTYGAIKCREDLLSDCK